MATQIHTCGSLGRQCHRRRQVLLCQSQSRRGCGRRARRRERGRVLSGAEPSTMPAKSHSALAEGFGRTAHAMAALRRKRAI